MSDSELSHTEALLNDQTCGKNLEQQRQKRKRRYKKIKKGVI